MLSAWVGVFALMSAAAGGGVAAGSGETGFNRCCDLFSYGFCMDLPKPHRVVRSDSGLSFVVHTVTFADEARPAFSIYEGNAPSVDDGGSGGVNVHHPDSELSARGRYFERGTANGERLHFVTRTGHDWPRYVHVWASWRDEGELERVESAIANLSTDRTELPWSPDCEARQEEFFPDWPVRNR